MRKLLLPALLVSGAASARAELQVLVDHVGYDTAESHPFFLVQGGPGEVARRFVVRRAAGGEVTFSGELRPAVTVGDWRFPARESGAPRMFFRGELGSTLPPGEYVIEVTGDKGERAQSCAFRVAPDLLEQAALSNVLFYFKGQRVSGEFERADEHLHLPAQLGGGVVDLGGGWYDATGDYGVHLSHQNLTSYFNPQQVPLVAWSLLASYEALGQRGDANFTQFRRQMLDEGLYGADFLVRMKVPGQSFLESISAPGKDKLATDREVGNPNWRTQIKVDPGASTEQIQAAVGPLAYQAGLRSGAGVAVAALALASTMPRSGTFSREQYLTTAEEAFDFLAVHNRELLNDGTENILDDYCALLAATELFHASHEARYGHVARERATRLIERLTTIDGERDVWRANGGDRPFFHPSDAGLPVIALLRYRAEAAADDPERERVRQAAKRAMQSELRMTEEVANPFGYARQLVEGVGGAPHTAFFFPHDTEAAPWWQGENARLASLAGAARMAAMVFPEDASFRERMERYAEDQLHWILGRNPFDSSMLMGSGHGNPAYMFFRSYQYASAPGGIVNGITSSESHEGGIAFNEGFAVTGKDEDWRWAEEWLPHAAWFLYAVSLPHGGPATGTPGR